MKQKGDISFSPTSFMVSISNIHPPSRAKGVACIKENQLKLCTSKSLHSKGTVNLDIPPAQGARTMPDEPAINAQQMEHMLAMRQAPHRLSDLKILRSHDKHIIRNNQQNKQSTSSLDFREKCEPEDKPSSIFSLPNHQHCSLQ